LGAELVTVSCDTQFVHLAWQREEKELADVRFPMGADPTGTLARQFGIYLDDAGLALRGSFLVNPEGKLMNTEVNFLNLGRNVDELLRKFKANIYLSKKPAEGCPSKWQDDGDATLTPGPEMVGRVHEALQK
jgi:peroxiredoxin (alkyl hydroperoxide reductase subunit C)